MAYKERLRASTWSDSKMTGRGKAERGKVEWQQVIEASGRRMMEGMQEICDTMKNRLMKLVRSEMADLKKDIGEMKEDIES